GEAPRGEIGSRDRRGERVGELLGGEDAFAHEPLAERPVVLPRADLRRTQERFLPENVGEPALLEGMPDAHLTISATWNTGRYMTMMIPPISTPISSISNGSISAMTRARRLSSTSSQNCATPESIASRPPEASPTSIIRAAIGGIRVLARTAWPRLPPSVTCFVACLRRSRYNWLVSEPPAVRSASTSGVPPASNVASERASC